ncbi:DNA-binding IclR family transcriptional regulator [Paenarthrobacter nitroguajacolicus]|nr:DNA-binding IclR family transcriptional regulator [Paenarthrobacter nitroguajacolicus]
MEIVERTGLTRSTVHRLLTTLQELGYLDRDESTTRWYLGPELHILGTVAAQRYAVSSVARRIVAELAASTGETALLSMRRADEVVYLVRTEGNFPLRSSVLQEGVRLPLGVSAGGLALLAYQKDEFIHRYLQELDLESKWGPQYTAASIFDRVRRTREMGYAINPGVDVKGSFGMAAAAVATGEPTRFALTITGVESRFKPERQRELGKVLLSFAHKLAQIAATTRGGAI